MPGQEQNERYEFPTTLEVAWAGGGGGRAPSEAQAKQRGKALADEFGRACKKERVVYSAYGVRPGTTKHALPAVCCYHCRQPAPRRPCL